MTTVWQMVASKTFEALRTDGWRKKLVGGFLRHINGDFYGWIGLNSSNTGRRTPILVIPNIGVRHSKIEDIVAHCNGYDANPFTATVVRSPWEIKLEEGLPAYWTFDKPDEMQATLDDMIHCIRRVGYPFIEANTNLEGLLKTLRERQYHPYERERIPVVLFMLGRSNEAKQFIESVTQRISKDSENIQEWFKSYQSNLIRIFD